MSDRLRVGVACEGPTDKILLDGLLKAFFGTDRIVSRPLQPPDASVLLSADPFAETTGGDFGRRGGGWPGVLRWCEESALGDGSLSGAAAFANLDLVIVHLDADVARETDLAAENLNRPCPPAGDACNALRDLLTRRLGGGPLPAKLVFCIPADCTEAWIIAALAPAVADANLPWECYPKPETLLPSVMVRGMGVGKSQKSYTRHLNAIVAGWPNARARCSEAARFDAELRAALPQT